MNTEIADCVEWELTRACNLRCRHCYARPGRRRRDELDTRHALDLARGLARSGCRSLALSGGEPTLRRDWPRIAGALAAEGVMVQMVSNGQMLGRDEALAARSAGVRMVMLSLDGMRETHDSIRSRAGAFDGLVRARDALVAAGVPFGLVTTVLRENARELERIASFASASGAGLWQVWLGIPQDRSKLWLDPAGAARLARSLPALREICPVLVPGDSLRHLVSWGQPGCESGRGVMGVQSDGAVRGCLALGDRVAAATRGSMCQALARSPFGRSARPRPARIAAVAASVLVASSIACGPRNTPSKDVSQEGRGVTTEPDGVSDPAQETRVADTVEVSTPLTVDLEEPCVCVSKEKKPDGTPVSQSPCMCVSHMMCPPSTMWLCPPDTEKKIQYVEQTEPD